MNEADMMDYLTLAKAEAAARKPVTVRALHPKLGAMRFGKGVAAAGLEAHAGPTEASQIASALLPAGIDGSTMHGYPPFHNAALTAVRR